MNRCFQVCRTLLIFALTGLLLAGLLLTGCTAPVGGGTVSIIGAPEEESGVSYIIRP